MEHAAEKVDVLVEPSFRACPGYFRFLPPPKSLAFALPSQLQPNVSS